MDANPWAHQEVNQYPSTGYAPLDHWLDEQGVRTLAEREVFLYARALAIGLTTAGEYATLVEERGRGGALTFLEAAFAGLDAVSPVELDEIKKVGDCDLELEDMIRLLE